MDHLLQKAQALLPLPQLIVKLGDAELSQAEMVRGALIRSPLREDRNPSFSIYNRGGKWRWSDKGTGDGGDEVDYLARREGLPNPEARQRFLEVAGVGGRDAPAPKPVKKAGGGISFQAGAPKPGANPAPQSNPVPAPKQPSLVAIPFSWEACQKAMGEAEIRSVAEWRGLTPEFVTWARDRGWIGWHKGAVAFPVHDKAGKVVSCHFRTEDGWRFPQGTKPTALVFGEPSKAGFLVLMESQWDALAALQAMEAHRNPTALSMLSFAISRGASNAALLVGPVKAAVDAGKRVAAFEQNDPEPEDGEKPYGNFIWAPAVAKLTRGVCFAGPPAEIKDANDWLKAGMTGADFLDRMAAAQPKRTTTLTLRTVAELRSMKFDDSDCYLGDRMLAAGQPTSFLGPGGIGKSRMVLQLAVSCILGMKFLDLETHAAGKKWLILQTENSNRRIRADLDRLIKGFDLGDEALRTLNRSLMFHTIETDDDALLDLGDPEVSGNVAAAVFDVDPDFVVLDPLNTFTSGDLNSDRDCRATITAISHVVRRGNPNRVPFVVHHSLTGKAGASKAVGWDRGSYGRNSKVLHAWVRSQWNLAPADPDDASKLILACGKNNNGRPFEEIGVHFDEETGIYQLDEAFDPATYRESIGIEGGKKKKGAAFTIDDITAVMESQKFLRVGTIQRRFCEQQGSSRAHFYRLWGSLKATSRVEANEEGEWRRVG